MNYAADVLTELKVRESELIDEKIDYLASIIKNSIRIQRDCKDTPYSREAIEQFALYTYQAMHDADVEHCFMDHLIKFFESDNVSRLDNDPILEDILYLLVDLSDIEDERMENQVDLEVNYSFLIEHDAFTSRNTETPTYESGLEKEKVRMYKIYSRTGK